eukprot:NODE_1296_length_1182_cov_265.506655.p1 GENE.NODE_1296_length_1182_cov_265.506655~~NODE_1296_length_1182_cov_265.506655.p1  ORF type:complete len:295 (-),score=86.39 NODE_1296_length_1182_cov_265.506655:282-1121(-)
MVGALVAAQNSESALELVNEREESAHLLYGASERPCPADAELPTTAITPRQRKFRDNLVLPAMVCCPPAFDAVSAHETDEAKHSRLLEMFKEFTLGLYTGKYIALMMPAGHYVDVHCQLHENLETLMLDMRNGHIIEFPLANVSKVFRVVKCDTISVMAGSACKTPTRHIIILSFARPKLAFAFTKEPEAKRFMICMEILIRKAQKGGAGSAATPTKRAHAKAQVGAIGEPAWCRVVQIQHMASGCLKKPGDGIVEPSEPGSGFTGHWNDFSEEPVILV